jgi:hypothetical protein
MTCSAVSRWFRGKVARVFTARRVVLLVEQLGERIVPSKLIPVANHRDLVHDATRDQLDITTSAGKVKRFDLASQSLLASLTVGTSLNGADITPDGSTLYVTEGQTINGQYGRTTPSPPPMPARTPSS